MRSFQRRIQTLFGNTRQQTQRGGDDVRSIDSEKCPMIFVNCRVNRRIVRRSGVGVCVGRCEWRYAAFARQTQFDAVKHVLKALIVAVVGEEPKHIKIVV